MKAFDEYTSKFNKKNRISAFKYNHSYRVSSLCNMLSTSLGLDESDIKLSTLIGLIHDIGRFEQAEKYNTMNDINTMDHGDFGEYLLFNEGLITMFCNDKKLYNIIRTSVAKHNKYSINKEYEPRELMHLKIVKDADKLDIFNIWSNLDELELKSDGEISKEVRDDFYNHRMIHNEYKKTNADSIIGTLSYIYEIYHMESFDYIEEQDFINRFYDRLENKEKFEEFFIYSDDYVKSKVNKGEKVYVRKKV